MDTETFCTVRAKHGNKKRTYADELRVNLPDNTSKQVVVGGMDKNPTSIEWLHHEGREIPIMHREGSSSRGGRGRGRGNSPHYRGGRGRGGRGRGRGRGGEGSSSNGRGEYRSYNRTIGGGYSLMDLVDVLKDKMYAEKPKVEILGWLLKVICVHNGLRMRTERTDGANGSTIHKRVILSSDKNSDSKTRLHYECNGAVFDSETWECIAVPPKSFISKFNRRAVDSQLCVQNYDIYQVNDGTIVTLYYYDGSWAMSSSNGYDVSNLKWMGDKCYAEIVYELLSSNEEFAEKVGVSLVNGKINFEKLDQDTCYTIGFRHHDFHPMKSDPQGIWNIQAVKFGTYAKGLPYVPYQYSYTYEELFGLTSPTLEALERSLDNSLETSSSFSQTDGVRKCGYSYGYILRSKNVTFPDIIIESPLLKLVRKLVYKKPNEQVQSELTSETRSEYNAMKAFLNESRDFLKLFPQFEPQFEQYREFTSSLIDKVLELYRKREAESTGEEEEKQHAGIDKLAKAILNYIIESGNTFKPFDEDARTIVKDFVMRPEYATMYLAALR